MYIAHSALQNLNLQIAKKQNTEAGNELSLRYQAHQSVCERYRHEIIAIQKYIPGWQPKFRNG